MSQPHLVSFLELDNSSSVHIGAGMASAVLQRSTWSPFLRVMLREARPRGIGIRARFGTTRITEAGLEEMDQADPMLCRGACIEIVNFLTGLAFAFDTHGDRLLETIDDFWGVHWFSACVEHPLEIRTIDADAAWEILGANSHMSSVVVIQFGGMRQQFAEIMKSFSVFRSS